MKKQKKTPKAKKNQSKMPVELPIEEIDFTNFGIPPRDLKKNMGCGG